MPATEDLERTLERIARHDGELGAFVDVLDERARREAAEVDAETAPGAARGPLHGMPIGIKEIVDVAGADNSYGSDVRAGLVAERDAPIVQRLRAAGAVIAGTTRSHEFAWGVTTQHATRGSTRNPWNLERVPGGSSGGSGAAVAAGLVDLVVGTDTGGSVRLPAAFCGVLGLKTTFGRIPRTGIVPLAPSLEGPGFLARSAPLLAAALAATMGSDGSDPSTIGTPGFSAGELDVGALEGMRFAVPDGWAPLWADAARRSAIAAFADGLAELGAQQVDVDVPAATDLYEMFAPIQLAEALDVHARVLGTFPARSADYGADVRARLERAGAVTLSDYLAARDASGRATAEIHRVLESVDFLVGLVGGSGPSEVSSPGEVEIDGQMVPLREAVMPSTVPQNLAGLPSVTVPFGLDAAGMPIGIQLTGARWSEHRLLSVAWTLEQAGAISPVVAPRYRSS